MAQKVNVLTNSSADAHALKRAGAQGVRVMAYDSGATKEAHMLFVNQAQSDTVSLQMRGHGCADRLQRKVRGAVEHTHGHQPECMNRADEDAACEQPRIREDEAGADARRRRASRSASRRHWLSEAFPNFKAFIVPADIELAAACALGKSWHRSNSPAWHSRPS
ncbi:hypothetical protein [Variovorax sp. 770b2]|uniref:hypothetical protein n=1 Tax=Variovorax sp. 770b2 TaxID=1566271 RepID=UPI0011602312|nr:hypothetical protein [Variovorax sp. 770b2]